MLNPDKNSNTQQSNKVKTDDKNNQYITVWGVVAEW